MEKEKTVPPLVFRNAMLIDGTGAPPVPDRTLVLADGLIRDIAGPRTRPPKGARIFDLKGRELAIKAEVLGPMGAIVAATRTNAELFGLSDSLGTLEPGKIADLIVTATNPLEDIGLFENGLRNVLVVVKDGQVFKSLL